MTALAWASGIARNWRDARLTKTVYDHLPGKPKAA
jgi:hypothetical protein